MNDKFFKKEESLPYGGVRSIISDESLTDEQDDSASVKRNQKKKRRTKKAMEVNGMKGKNDGGGSCSKHEAHSPKILDYVPKSEYQIYSKHKEEKAKNLKTLIPDALRRYRYQVEINEKSSKTKWTGVNSLEKLKGMLKFSLLNESGPQQILVHCLHMSDSVELIEYLEKPKATPKRSFAYNVSKCNKLLNSTAGAVVGGGAVIIGAGVLLVAFTWFTAITIPIGAVMVAIGASAIAVGALIGALVTYLMTRTSIIQIGILEGAIVEIKQDTPKNVVFKQLEASSDQVVVPRQKLFCFLDNNSTAEFAVKSREMIAEMF